MHPKIILSTTDHLVDDDLKLNVVGLKSNQQLKLSAEMKDDMNRTWSSFGVFTANNEGQINLDITPSEKGTYLGCNPNGLLWSMTLKAKDPSLPPMFFKNGTQPNQVIFYLTVGDEIIDKKEMQMNYTTTNIKSINIEKPMIGKLFIDEEKTNMPGIVVVGGSTGGLFWAEQMAAVLSTKGYAALALNYFDPTIKTLPDKLIEIPLEYFEKSLNWLKEHPQIDENNISMMGISKGGELSLVFASYFSHQLTSILSYVPSSHIFEGIAMNGHPKKSSWTYKDKALNFVKFPKDSVFSMTMNPLDIRKIHDEALMKGSHQALENARIKIETIDCPILLISGDKDTTWSSAKMCTHLMKMIEEHNNPYQSKHVNFKNMGHTFFLPNIPPIIDHPSVSPENAAKANKIAWENTLEFLSKHFN